MLAKENNTSYKKYDHTYVDFVQLGLFENVITCSRVQDQNIIASICMLVSVDSGDCPNKTSTVALKD